MSALAIPCDVGIADISIYRDGYAVARVVKANDLGRMWTVEVLQLRWGSDEHTWSEPKRRKVTKWLPIDPEQATKVARKVHGQYDAFREAEKELTRAHHATIVNIAGEHRP